MSSTTLAERQRQTALSLLLAYKIWSLEDATSLDKIFLHRTPDCIQATLPRTAGVPDRNNEQYKSYLQSLVLADLAPWEGELHIESPIVSDAEARVCVARVHGTAKIEGGKGEVHDRTVWFLHFPDEVERERVNRVEVWVDTRQAWAFREKFGEYQEEKKKRKEKRPQHPLWDEASGRKKSRSPKQKTGRSRSRSLSSGRRENNGG